MHTLKFDLWHNLLENQSSKREVVGLSAIFGKKLIFCNSCFRRGHCSSPQPIQMKSTVTTPYKYPVLTRELYICMYVLKTSSYVTLSACVKSLANLHFLRLDGTKICAIFYFTGRQTKFRAKRRKLRVWRMQINHQEHNIAHERNTS